MNWDKSLKIGGSIAGLLVSVITIVGSINYYIDSNYVSRDELGKYSETLNNNNEVILNVIKTVGSSFYESTLLDVDAAVKTLEAENHLTAEQKLQLSSLKLLQAKLNRDKQILESMKLRGIIDSHE